VGRPPLVAPTSQLPARVAVMGDSAGGGLAAAVALLAGDRGGPALAHQILIYPMLDDRNATPDPEIAPFAVWSYDDNLTGWGTLLGDAIGTDKVPAYAAPARATDLSGLPACYIEVVSSTSFVTKTLITPCVSAEPVYLSSSTSAPACRTSSKLTATPPTSPAVPRRTASGCSVRFRQRFRQALRATRPIKATRPTKGATSDRRRPHQIPSVVGTAR
jgi:hypothetical protein